MKPKYQISFSGGRTSGYMTKKLIDNFSHVYDFIVTFTNTGLEDWRTLLFVHNCDKYFGFKTVWLESVVNEGRVSSSHRIVTYETASRNGEPFENFIKKYGIPNVAFPSCNRELKLNPMHSYLKSIGIHHKDIPTAIGIRSDESRRISKDAELNNLVYPLIDIWPTDKQDVLDWWEDQIFDLGIEEFEGNCKGCFKKSLHKHFLQIEKDPSVYDFHERMEGLYKHIGPQNGDRVFFRGNKSKVILFQEYEEYKKAGNKAPKQLDLYANGGCSESCEPYPMENDGLHRTA